MRPEELLLDSLNNSTPILFLGAGFSFKALNYANQRIELAAQLTTNIFSEFYEKKRESYMSDEYIKSVKLYSLKDLCTTIKQESPDRKEQLYDFLIDTFKGAHPDPGNDFHKKVQEYDWTRIYTLNIDDLIENIYLSEDKEILVQNEKSMKSNSKALPELFKLHGCVNKRDNGFIFSSDEYISMIENVDFKMKEFANDYYKNDVIFVGTELDEDDITYILKNYLSSGYGHNTKCFYICPSFKPKLLSQIKAEKNSYIINWDTEKFLDCLSSSVKKKDIEKENINHLVARGFQSVEDALKNKGKYYTPVLYNGYPPFYNEILDEWDIAYPRYEERKKEFLQINESTVIALYGKMYVGKTCIARRITVDFFNEGFVALEFRMENSLDFAMLSKYISSYADGTRFAIMVDDASQLYRRLYEFLDRPEMKKYLIVFITTSNILHHMSKRHELILHDYKDLYIDPGLTYQYSRNIYEKLSEKRRLGILSKYADTPKSTVAFIKQQKDIINLLFLLTHGKGFQEYFEEMINHIVAPKEYFDLFYSVAIFSVLEIDGYPREFLINLHKKIQIKELEKHFGDLLYFTKGRRFLKVRCSNLMETIVVSKLSSQQVIDYIYPQVVYLKGLFSEKAENIYSDYFHVLIKETFLHKKLKISYEVLRQYYTNLEKHFSDISYYWMQRAILEQHDKKFEDAEIFINNAKKIRPDSYQAQHALAKNRMERALKELEEGSSYSVAAFMFEEGEKSIIELINNPKYSRSFCYSVHAYLDMKMKYCKKIHTSVGASEAILYSKWILRGLQLSNDKYMNDIKNRFIEFALKMGYNTEIQELCNYRYQSSSIIMDDIDEYLE
ncbi:MAG: SIR2 family protein [Clostridia bacterium]